jgi:hypothetical protein
MLACSCDYDDPAWWHEDGGDVKPLNTKRMRRCCSCKDRIAVGEDCMAFPRWRTPNYGSIEERIFGEGGEVWLATWYLCDRCAGLYESLDGLGFCNLLGQDLRSVCREYAQMQREAGVFRGQMAARTVQTNVRANRANDGATGV